jgi:hypothetical protein
MQLTVVTPYPKGHDASEDERAAVLDVARLVVDHLLQRQETAHDLTPGDCFCVAVAAKDAPPEHYGPVLPDDAGAAFQALLDKGDRMVVKIDAGDDVDTEWRRIH